MVRGVSHIILVNCTKQYARPFDSVREKIKNCALFWRRIVRDKEIIARVLVRDCAILGRTKYFVFHSLLK